TYSDTFSVQSADGTLTSVTIHIAGTNDAAVLSADTKTLTETNLAADDRKSTRLNSSHSHSSYTFVAQTETAGTYGTFAIDSAGASTYTATPSLHDALPISTYSDTFSVQSADGTLTSVTIHIAGTNDAAVLSADTKTLTETNLAADISTAGTLTISDVDSPEIGRASCRESGPYCGVAVDSAGSWTNS